MRSERPRLTYYGDKALRCSYCLLAPGACLCWASPAEMSAWAEAVREVASQIRHKRRWARVDGRDLSRRSEAEAG